ncbi:hypothetical protein O6H91_04G007000 [Diphasiastrum complanatum]|nr:hypothetical protein O6H91_04G007000 [Diphasiastrum complanatum]
MRRNRHFIVPASDFKLEEGSEHWLTTYTFGTKQAQHIFCKVCGITSYYIPRSNPDGVAVTVGCIDPGTIDIAEIREFDGQNWENFYGSSGIAEFSKSEDDK